MSRIRTALAGASMAGYLPRMPERFGAMNRGIPVFEPEGGGGGGEAEMKAAVVDLKKATDEVKRFAEKTTAEIKTLGEVSAETKVAADKALSEMNAISERLTGTGTQTALSISCSPENRP